MSSHDLQPPTFTPGLFEGGFEPYLRAVRRHRLLVVLVTLAAVLGAAAWLAARTPHYKATTHIVVTPMPFDDSTFDGVPVLHDTPGDPTRAVQTAAVLIETPAAAQAAAQALGHGWTQASVGSAVTVTPAGGTNVLAVQATARTRADAIAVAQAYSHAALEQRRESLAASAKALVAQLKSVPAPPQDRVMALLPLVQGFDPSFSQSSNAAPSASLAARSPGRVLASALVAGLVLAVGAALLSDGVLRRRRAEPAPAEDAGAEPEPDQGTVHELSRRAEWPPS
ncbi:MAG: Wzz/FepE/Etk N-terminal domain-containing protein [Thermoleophilaceae bacterium]